MSERAQPARVDLVELRRIRPHVLAGARALRERQRWAGRVALLSTDAQQARRDAEKLERFARWLDRAGQR